MTHRQPSPRAASDMPARRLAQLELKARRGTKLTGAERVALTRLRSVLGPATFTSRTDRED
jgi:hypothetical protein